MRPVTPLHRNPDSLAEIAATMDTLLADITGGGEAG